ncbi:RNA polymerase-associated protein RTF1 homolog [Drosophila innubila]|uniref:RNA polymerase-associated protein RTF1 homolog n=1 Tax=Drosophila innubila TaxID=198719 RepID=UPI00148C12F1|nr:RNA polymerase-associated protein RTF1 homolog [Drosophila innubila]
MLAVTVNSRKRQLSLTDDLEGDELQQGETVSNFNDGYDENLMGDAADRIRLEGLSELERERELYERSLKREEQMIRWGIKNMLLEKNQSESSSEIAEVVKERSSTRRLHRESQRVTNKKRSAFDRLVAQRNKKRNRDEVEIMTHITADEDDEEMGQQQEQDQDQEMYASGRDSTFKKLKLKAEDVYSDDSSVSSEEDDYMEQNEPVVLVESLMELGKAILTRHQLEDFLDKPIFDQTVIGCFVRVSIGAALNEQPSIYRLSEIVALDSIEQEYQVGSRRTKRVLQLKHGGHQRSFLMNVVSNQPVTSSEFSYFLEACQRDAQPLPNLRRISEKAKDIEKATNYAFTEGDVELMVQTKRQAGQKLVSAAYRKVCLIMERDMAIESNDKEKANRLEREIKQIDEKSLTEPQREKRVQYMSSTAKPIPVQTSRPQPATKSKFNSKKIDWQQYMRKRYKKIVSLQRQQIKMEPESIEEECFNLPAATQPDQKPNKEENTEKESQQIESVIDLDKLNLYELHNFKICLDVSNLLEFNAIFSESEASCLL